MGMGGSNKASEEAQRAEAERLAQIKATQGAVNSVFDGPARGADIANFINASRDYYTADLNRQKGETDRQLRFALARNGQTGGSTQVDQAKEFSRVYGRGLLDVERKAQGDGASIEAADQDARARLLSLATTGLDATTAAQQSAAALRTNLQAGAGERNMGALGDAFSSFKDFIDRSRDAADRQRGYAASGLPRGWYANPGYGGSGGGYGG